MMFEVERKKKEIQKKQSTKYPVHIPTLEESIEEKVQKK